jgi:hypothetical protein
MLSMKFKGCRGRRYPFRILVGNLKGREIYED